MTGYIHVKEAAKLWNIGERQVSHLCKIGKVNGALKQGRSWMIPVDAEKPADQRIKTGAYIQSAKTVKLPLPVGISDYRLASSSYYYIDKTMMIKDFIDERPMVSLFTRPRRFGKTLNMDMLRVFFEKTDSDTSVYFKDKKIWACGEQYRAYQGKYPVIYVTFKDVKCESWESTYDLICQILRNEVQRHSELLSSNRISAYDKKYLESILSGSASEIDMAMTFMNLSRMLDAHYDKAPIIIIDEYDTPIQQGHTLGYYDKVISFMRNLFSGGLKDNKHLSFGFLTGILRVAKESIFSGLNNLVINSVLDNKYSAYFGFTPDEVREMARYYGVSEKYDEICEWYDGYRFGNSEIFNPWSVINYFNNECKPKAFWLSTGSNDIIGEIITQADQDIYDKLTSLVSGNTIVSYIDTSVTYPQIKQNPSAIYSFLLVAGYLNAVKAESSYGIDYMCELALPNKEITFVYSKEILQKLDHIIPQSIAISVQEAIYSGDSKRIQALIHNLLLQSASSFDTVGENFYHGFMLGLCAMLSGSYTTSNRESGEGRYDIQLLPRDAKLPGILIELKAEKNCSEDELKKLSETALQQINDRKYDTEMTSMGITAIHKYGVAFSGKSVEVAVG
ncbi:AAA family ATPase [Lawsonibacter sp. LCP25S3_F5]